jgi:hypothetical protein
MRPRAREPRFPRQVGASQIALDAAFDHCREQTREQFRNIIVLADCHCLLVVEDRQRNTVWSPSTIALLHSFKADIAPSQAAAFAAWY